MVKGDEVFPADLIALSSSNSGVCYIETSTLDGERNLKLRIALRETSQRFTALGWNLNLDQ
jgi:phospholipid-transporting ATPase